jgi:hypothetical protein
MHKIFIVGDSHSLAYSPMMENLHENYNVEVIHFSSLGCNIADFRGANVYRGDDCVKYVEDTLTKIKSLASKGDILFLASLRMNRLCDQFIVFPDDKFHKPGLEEQQLIYNEVDKIKKEFQKEGLIVLIDAPKPILKMAPFRCSDWFNKLNPICEAGTTIDRDFLLNHRKQVMQSLEKLQENNPQLVIWDPFPLLCKTDKCSAVDDTNKPLFFDGDHISGYVNKLLYPAFSKVIEEIWLK